MIERHGDVGLKAIAFRPSEEAREAIDKLIKEKKAKNPTEACNQLIKKAIQLEHPDEGKFFQFPPWMLCPKTRMYHLTETLLDPQNDEGCLKSECKKRCRAWNNTGTLF